MRVFKNLFGDGSKIHGDEVVVGIASRAQILNDALFVYRGNAPTDIASITQSGIYAIGRAGSPGYSNFFTTGSAYGTLLVFRRYFDLPTFMNYIFFGSTGLIRTCVKWDGVMGEWKSLDN